MADSDYDFEDDGSDDEYIGSRAPSASRAGPSTSKRKGQEKPRKLQAWETDRSLSAPTYTVTVEEGDDGTIKQSVQEKEEDRKRKR
jgi:transcription initiation factor TFIIH subunit 2